MHTELGFFDVVSPILGYCSRYIIPFIDSDGLLDSLKITDHLALP